MDEIAGAGDGPVHVGFGRQVHHVRDGMLSDAVQHGGFVAQIDLFKDVFGIAVETFQIDQVAGIGQAIEVDEPVDFRPVDDLMNDIGADEPRAAGDEEVHDSGFQFRRRVFQGLLDGPDADARGQQLGHIEHAIGSGRFGGDAVEFLVVLPELKRPGGLRIRSMAATTWRVVTKPGLVTL